MGNSDGGAHGDALLDRSIDVLKGLTDGTGNLQEADELIAELERKRKADDPAHRAKLEAERAQKIAEERTRGRPGTGPADGQSAPLPPERSAPLSTPLCDAHC
jgi:hypothetical protein